MSFSELKIDVAGQSFAAKRWHQGDGLPVLALHGWLDNSASFDFIAPQMQGLDLLCVDLAGHGLSSHRQDYASYTLWREVIEMFALADELGWQEFALLGHSRGAAISMLMAGTHPERISHLGLIEGVFPLLNSVEEGPEHLRAAIKYLKHGQAQSPSQFDNFDNAVEARVNGMFEISRADAEALAHRSLREKNNQFYWHYDYKLKVPSEIRMSKDQVDVYAKEISMPVHIVLGDEGYFSDNSELLQWLDEYPAFNRTILKGGHHLHMSENADKVSEVLNAFYR